MNIEEKIQKTEEIEYCKEKIKYYKKQILEREQIFNGFYGLEGTISLHNIGKLLVKLRCSLKSAQKKLRILTG